MLQNKKYPNVSAIHPMLIEKMNQLIEFLGEKDFDKYFASYEKIPEYLSIFEYSVFWFDWPKKEEDTIKRERKGIADLLINAIKGEDEKASEEIIGNIIRRTFWRYNFWEDHHHLGVLEELRKLIEEINENYWKLKINGKSFSCPIPPIRIIDEELVWKITIKIKKKKTPKEITITYAYPKSTLFVMWVKSPLVTHYSKLEVEEDIADSLNKRWLQLFLDKYLPQGSLNYQDIDIILNAITFGRGKVLEELKELIHKRSRSDEVQASLCRLIEVIHEIEERNPEKGLIEEFLPKIEEDLIIGSPAWEKAKLLMKSEINKRSDVYHLNTQLRLGNLKYDEINYDVFLAEKTYEIVKKAERFCNFMNRKASKKKEATLIALWLNQFKRLILRDFVWDLLNNLKYFSSKDMLDTYDSFLKNHLGNVSNEEVLFLMEKLGGPSSILDSFFRNKGLKKSVIIVEKKKFEKGSVTNIIDKLSENKSIRNIIYIDDIIGTGKTTKAILNNLNSVIQEAKRDDIKIQFWAICASSKNILDQIINQFQNVEIVVQETLEKHNLEHVLNNEKYRDEESQLRRTLEKICSELVEKDNPFWDDKMKKEYCLGYGGKEGGELLVAFETNCPNNTLPIFWKDGEFDGKPYFALFPRLEGLKEEIINGVKKKRKYYIKWDTPAAIIKEFSKEYWIRDI